MYDATRHALAQRPGHEAVVHNEHPQVLERAHCRQRAHPCAPNHPEMGEGRMPVRGQRAQLGAADDCEEDEPRRSRRRLESSALVELEVLNSEWHRPCAVGRQRTMKQQ